MLSNHDCSQHFNWPIQMIKGWKKYQTFNVIYPLVKHQFAVNDFTSYIFDMCVNMFYFVVFWCNDGRYRRHYVLYFHFYWYLILYIIIHQWIINSRHSMLAHTFCSQHFNWQLQNSKSEINSQQQMLALH